MKEHEILQWLLKRERVLLEERTKLEKRIETVHKLCDEFEHMILTNDFNDNTEFTEPAEKICENEDSTECSCSEIDTQINETKKQLELSENNIQADEKALIQNIDADDIIAPELHDALSDLKHEWETEDRYNSNYNKSPDNKVEEKSITKKIEQVIDLEKFKKIKKRAVE